MNPPCPPFECAHMWLVQLGLSVVLQLFVASVTYLRNWLFFHPWFWNSIKYFLHDMNDIK